MMTFIGILLFFVTLGLGVYTSLSIDPHPHFKIGRFLPFLAGAFALLILSSSFVEIDAGSRAVVKRWGQPVREFDPGLHLLTPFAESATTIAVQSRVVKTNEEAASKDLQIVKTEITLRYRLDPKYVTQFLVELNNDAEERVIKPSVLESIKAVTARYTAEDLIAKRAEVRDGIEAAIAEKLRPSHIIADQTSITNFTFSPTYNQAIEAKVTAEQQAQAAKNTLETVKFEADQKVATAQGEARALAAQRNQITPELLQLRTIEMLKEKWNGKLPDTVISGGNQNPIPFLDVLKAAGKN